MAREHLSVLQKVKALDEFKKQQNAKKTLPQLGLVARSVLKLDYTPSEAAIRRWKKAETKLRDQAKTIKPISKHDRYRRRFEVKNVQRPETIQEHRTVNEINVDAESSDNVESDEENNLPGPEEEFNDNAETDDEIIMEYIPPKKRKAGQQLVSDYFNQK